MGAEGLQRNNEGKYVFANQEVYEKALEERIAIKKGMNSQEFQELLNPENVVFTPADATQNTGQPADVSREMPKPAESAAQPAKSSALIEKMRERAKAEGLDLDYQTDEELLDAVISKEKRTRYLTGEVEKLTSSAPVTESELIQSLRREVEGLKKPAANTETPVDVGPSKANEIDYVRGKLNALTDPYGDEGFKLQRELTDLLAHELARTQKLQQVAPKNNDIIESIKELKAELQSVKSRAEKEDFNQKVEQEKKAEVDAIDSFFRSHKDMATSKPILKLDADYCNWASELYRIAYGRKASNAAEMKQVVDMVLSDVDFQKKAKSAGIEKPAEVEKYLDVCDLINIRKNLNDAFGHDHTLEQAWVYRMGKDGTINDAMLAQRTMGAEAVKNAGTKRDMDFARTLDASAGASPEQVGDELSSDEAMKILNAISPLQARKDPAKNALLDKAYKKLGINRS